MPSHNPDPSTSPSYPPTFCAGVRPLRDHQQLSILTRPFTTDPGGPVHVEYRVYNHRRLRSGRDVRGDGWGFGDLIWVVGLVWWFQKAVLWTLIAHEGHWTEQVVRPDNPRFYMYRRLKLYLLSFAVPLSMGHRACDLPSPKIPDRSQSFVPPPLLQPPPPPSQPTRKPFSQALTPPLSSPLAGCNEYERMFTHHIHAYPYPPRIHHSPSLPRSPALHHPRPLLPSSLIPTSNPAIHITHFRPPL